MEPELTNALPDCVNAMTKAAPTQLELSASREQPCKGSVEEDNVRADSPDAQVEVIRASDSGVLISALMRGTSCVT